MSCEWSAATLRGLVPKSSRGGGAEDEASQEGSGTWALSVRALKPRAPGEPPRASASHHVNTPRHPRAPRTHFWPKAAPRK